jgi:hypothetical protein
MKVSRQSHQATLLEDGTVLVSGGEGYDGAPLASAELFQPAEGTFKPVEDMAEPRIGHSATLLENGRILIAGGRKKVGTRPYILSSAELYDRGKRQFLPVAGKMNAPRWRHQARRLANGWVLVAGGLSAHGPIDSLEFFIPDEEVFKDAGTMLVARADFAMELLEDGRIFIAGGMTEDDKAVGGFETYEFEGETLKLVDSGNLEYPRYQLTATRLRDGRVLLAGGTSDGREGIAAGEIYDPEEKSVRSCRGSMITRRYRHSASLLSNGLVLLAGGYLWDAPKSAELYDPARDEFHLTDHLVQNRRNHQATVLQDGSVLITGGFTYRNGREWILREAETYGRTRLR